MPIERVLAGLAVADIDAALAWYGRLLGRPADDVPMREAAEWNVTEGGSIQLVLDVDRAGTSQLALGVDDLDAHVALLAERGFPLEAIETGMFRIATITDPEGNTVTFAQDLRGER